MLTLIPIAVLLITPLICSILPRWQLRHGILWLLSAFAALTAWVIVFILRLEIPVIQPIAIWHTVLESPVAIQLLVDQFSWPLAFAITILLASVLLVDISIPQNGAKDLPRWRSWANSLTITGLSLLAIFSGNILTLVLTWGVLDIGETFIWLGQVREADERKKVALGMSLRMAGSLLLIFVGHSSLHNTLTTSFEAILPEIAPLVILSCGLRLGILPFAYNFPNKNNRRHSLGVLLRLTPVAASLTPLVRASIVGINPDFYPFLLLIASLAALFNSLSWMMSDSEQQGSGYWIIGVGALAMIASSRSQPDASLVWSLSMLLPGGILLLSPLRTRWIKSLLIVGALSITSLPFTPTWSGVRLYSTPIHPFLFIALISNIFLLSGTIRHSLRSEPESPPAEKWLIILLFFGYFFCISGFFLITWWLPKGIGAFNPENPSWLESLPGFVITPLAVGIFYLYRSGRKINGLPKNTLQSFLSANWLSKGIGKLFLSIQRFVAFFNRVLEGQSGILWSLLLLMLILSFFVQASLGS